MRQVVLMTTFTYSATFDTVMGDIKLGKNGEWAHPPVLGARAASSGFAGVHGFSVREKKDLPAGKLSAYTICQV